MQWRRAEEADAAELLNLAHTSNLEADPGLARSFLRSWHVELAVEKSAVLAAVAVLPPSAGGHRGHGAWWHRDITSTDRLDEIIARLTRLAATIPRLTVLQVTRRSDDLEASAVLVRAGFGSAFPVWTMRYAGTSRSRDEPRLPKPLRAVRWTDIDEPTEAFATAYAQAYEDQRLVEPLSSEVWAGLIHGDSFAADLTRMAIDTDGDMVGFVVAFHSGHGVELGPIGTARQWRGRGVASALLASVLSDCRDQAISPVTLFTDGDSPTGAQRLYERLGFRLSESQQAFHRQIRP